MLDTGNRVSTYTTEKELQRLRDTGPFSNQEDPSVVHARVGAREICEYNTKVFRETGPKGDRCTLNFKNVVCHRLDKS